MEMKKLGNGPYRNYRGSIFILAIATLGIFTFLYLALSENYQLTFYTTDRNTKYYQMVIMKELFLSEYLALPKDQRPEQGSYHYSSGTVAFSTDKDTLVIHSKIKHHKHVFFEKIMTSNSSESNEQVFSENTSETTDGGIQFSGESSTAETVTQ